MFDEITHHILVSCVTAISIGVMLLILSRRFNIPGIVLLLLGGFALGPNGIGLVDPDALGSGLQVIASLSIGIILFEGGLTLDLGGYLSASSVIKRLLSVGVVLTWMLTSAAVYFIFSTDLSLALVCGSLVIVTGPTVIGPLLKRIKVTRKIHSILHWEGVLIDPIGVFIAVLCFEWIVTASGPTALTNFGLRVIVGLLFGLIAGFGIYFVERKRFVPDNMINVFALASAVLLFGVTESVLTEAGLLSVTVAGFVLGVKKPVRLEQIREFKAEITDLLIGTLFILLSARLSPEQFLSFGYRGIAVVAIVMFLVRPISIFFCTLGLDITWKEKTFLSWVAPRGIVAASMASLFALSGKINTPGLDDRFIETFVYSVIVGTIIFQGFTAGILARLLGLYDPRRKGWIVVGAHPFARAIASFINSSSEASVLLVDTNHASVNAAKRQGLSAVVGDARIADLTEIEEAFEVHSVGNLLALTDNESLNTLICQNWASRIGKENVYRWGTLSSTSQSHDAASGSLIWSDLPKPSIVSDAISSNSMKIASSENFEDEEGDLITPIISIITEEDKVLLDPIEKKTTKELSHTLYLKQ